MDTHRHTTRPRARGLRATLALGATLALLAGCGGGGGNPGFCLGSAQVCSAGQTGGGSAPAPAPAAPAGSFVGTDTASLPSSASAAGQCSIDEQKRFTRAYLHEQYLWYGEIPQVDARTFASVPAYFDALLVRTPDEAGLPKDRFSFTIPAAEADRLQTGSGLDYGVTLQLDAAGRRRVAYVVPGGPAERAGLRRGGVIEHGASAGPDAVHFDYRDTPAAAARPVTLQAALVNEDPVPLARRLATAGGKRVGYVLFNAFTQGAQDRLIAEVGALAAAGVDELVLDLRYNGGGFIYIAGTLASMVAAPSSEGRVFEQLRFNDKRARESAENRFNFSGRVQFAEARYPAGTALPQLALKRVYVLSSDLTCSASESVVNGLRGLDIEVVLVGGATCGKPYGFTRKDNCGLALFPIEFQGVNAKGFGAYSAGFAPTCPVADDFDRALGDTAEGQLAAALGHIDTGRCPAVAATPRSAPLAGALAGPPLRQRLPGRLLTPAR